MKKTTYKKASLIKGFLMKCPICGLNPLYSSYIKFNVRCSKCKTNYSNYKTEDGPAYFTIFLVGHIIIPAIVLIEGLDTPPPFWFQIIIWPIITIILSLLLLPRIKGAFLAFQINVNDTSS